MGVNPSLLMRSMLPSSTWRWVRQVPSPESRGITQSPGLTVLTWAPTARTSKQPSLPGTVPGREGVGGVGLEEDVGVEGLGGEG